MHQQALNEFEKGNREKSIELLLGGKIKGGGRTRGALRYLITVFVKQPESAFAADAEKRVEEIKLFTLGQYNTRIHFSAPAAHEAEIGS